MNLWGITDIGAVRNDNQDNFQIERLDGRNALAVVCDGMGGAKAGNIASSMAVSVFVQGVREAFGSGAPWPRVLDEAAQRANAQVFEKSMHEEDCRGMGTTLVAALVTPETIFILNVGDSRCYQILNGDMSQVTRDHSVVEDLLLRGDITKEQARTHPQKNLITRALGVEHHVRADLFERPNEGGCLLLCSDGMSNVLTDEELRREVVAQDREDCCRRLLRLALEKGAPDNVTAVVVEL